MVSFGTSGNSDNKFYEINVYADTDYNTAKTNITIVIENNYDINASIGIYINNTVIQQFNSLNLKSGINIYTFNTSIDVSKDNNIKLKINSITNVTYNKIKEEEISKNIPKKESIDDLGISFNKKYDKITDKEVVNNFISKMPIGDDLYDNNTLILHGNKKVTKYLSQLCMLNPIPEEKDISLYRFNIKKGYSSISATILGNISNYKIYRAYADKSRLDVSGLFYTSILGNKFIIKTDFDTPYPTDDIINVIISTN